MKKINFNVEQFKKDYYSGMVCLFGDTDEIENFIEDYSLAYNHKLEERESYVESGRTFIAYVHDSGYTFEQLVCCREVAICRLEEIYPVDFKDDKLQYNDNKIEASKETYWIIKETNPQTGKISTTKYTDKNQAINSYDARSVYDYYNDVCSNIELLEVDAITTYESRLLKDCK